MAAAESLMLVVLLHMQLIALRLYHCSSFRTVFASTAPTDSIALAASVCKLFRQQEVQHSHQAKSKSRDAYKWLYFTLEGR